MIGCKPPETVRHRPQNQAGFRGFMLGIQKALAAKTTANATWLFHDDDEFLPTVAIASMRHGARVTAQRTSLALPSYCRYVANFTSYPELTYEAPCNSM